MKIFKLVFLLPLMTGCTTIHFENGSNQPINQIEVDKWHHNLHMGLFEISEPVNLQEECGGKEWSKVTTEHTFANSIVPAAALTLVVGPTYSYLTDTLYLTTLYGAYNASGVWSPKTVTIKCSDAEINN